MTFSEKKLYHQIHPVKLGTDILASFITLILFWFHYFWISLILHFLFPILGSFFVIQYIPLEKQKQSPLGKYLKKYMNGWIETVRLIGDIIMIYGAWYHAPLFILFGLFVILIGWFNGKIFLKKRFSRN